MPRSFRTRSGAAFAGALVAVLALGAVVALTAGCGPFHTPLKVSVDTGVGPNPHEWSASITATGDGQADASLLLTYPDGHKVDQWDCLVQEGARSSSTLESLRSGTYSWTVYATHVGAGIENVFSLPSKDLTADNVVSSGSFTIP